MPWTLRSWVSLPAGCNQQPKQPLLHGTSQLRITTPAMEAANNAKSGHAEGGAKHLVSRPGAVNDRNDTIGLATCSTCHDDARPHQEWTWSGKALNSFQAFRISSRSSCSLESLRWSFGSGNWAQFMLSSKSPYSSASSISWRRNRCVRCDPTRWYHIGQE